MPREKAEVALSVWYPRSVYKLEGLTNLWILLSPLLIKEGWVFQVVIYLSLGWHCLPSDILFLLYWRSYTQDKHSTLSSVISFHFFWHSLWLSSQADLELAVLYFILQSIEDYYCTGRRPVLLQLVPLTVLTGGCQQHGAITYDNGDIILLLHAWLSSPISNSSLLSTHTDPFNYSWDGCFHDNSDFWSQ